MILKKNCCFFLIPLLALVSATCKESTKTNTSADVNERPPAHHELDIIDPNTAWQLIINADLDSLYPLYTREAYKVSDKGEMVRGNLRIMDLYKQKGLVINKIGSVVRIDAVLDGNITYEIGNFSTPDRTSYAHLIIWRKEGDLVRREFELVKERVPNTPVPSAIEERRQMWMALCNAHKITELINTLYTENTLYYNHRPMVVGREAVMNEYQYMTDPEYNLRLEPLTVEAVNENLVFEIGQCSGSYQGNYLLVWKKGEDGNWRILIDSNI